jgi:hypothetical protein
MKSFLGIIGVVSLLFATTVAKAQCIIYVDADDPLQAVSLQEGIKTHEKLSNIRAPRSLLDDETCAAFHKVNLECDRTTATFVVDYLSSNGKVLFPQAYYFVGDPLPENGYRWTEKQNAKLRENILRNQKLFEGGLTVEEVRLLWR